MALELCEGMHVCNAVSEMFSISFDELHARAVVDKGDGTICNLLLKSFGKLCGVSPLLLIIKYRVK